MVRETARPGAASKADCTSDECRLGRVTCPQNSRCLWTAEAGAACACDAGFKWVGPAAGSEGRTAEAGGQNGRCVAVCGDGAVLGGEECDDGNAAADDGCGSDCRLEPGWSCLPATGRGGTSCRCGRVYRKYAGAAM